MIDFRASLSELSATCAQQLAGLARTVVSLAHGLAHLHVNNGDLTLIQQATPHYLELTFIRKGILPETKELRKLLPIAGIDFSNQIGLPDFDIQFT